MVHALGMALSFASKLSPEELFQREQLCVMIRLTTSFSCGFLQTCRCMALSLLAIVPAARLLAETKHELHRFECTDAVRLEVLPSGYLFEACFLASD